MNRIVTIQGERAYENMKTMHDRTKCTNPQKFQQKFYGDFLQHQI
jgi:hypothetical protein